MKQNTGSARTTSELVYRRLREDIFSRRHRPGERLHEAELAEKLGVSRTPVREALHRLAVEKLVVFTPNIGARLANPTLQDVIDTWEVRQLLECRAVRRAAEVISAEELARLQKYVVEEEGHVERNDIENCIRINRHFHRAIAEASGNPVLAETIAALTARASACMIFCGNFFDPQTSPSLDEHRAILKALTARDAARAEQLMKAHLMISPAALEVALANRK